MPIYEYQCNQCGHRLESFEKMTDAPLTDCPSCGKPDLQRLVSAAGFQLKGTGWYATDFRDKGKPAAKSSDNNSSDKNTTSETKPKESGSTGTTSTTKDTAAT